MKKLFKNKKGKVFVMLTVLTILATIIALWAVITSKQDEFLGFGELQTRIILATNQKDADALYLDTAAQLAYKNTSQTILAEQGGFQFMDTVTGNSDDLGCGNHIYPLYVESSGKNCFKSIEPKKEYLNLFKENLYKYLASNSVLHSLNFELNIVDNSIVGIASEPLVYNILTDNNLDALSIVPPASTLNQESKVKLGAEVAKKAKTFTPQEVPGEGCAGYITNLLLRAYQENNKLDFPLPSCISGDAWDIAACFLLKDKSITEEKDKRVVYSGTGLEYSQFKNLLEEGDLLFLSTKTTWCKWSGYNYYKTNPEDLDNSLSYCEGESGRSALRANPEDGFCEKDTFDIPNYPNYCTFHEANMHLENFPIITHIMLYVGNGKIAHQWGSNYITMDLETFLRERAHRFDGVRIIIRPDYS